MGLGLRGKALNKGNDKKIPGQCCYSLPIGGGFKKERKGYVWNLLENVIHQK